MKEFTDGWSVEMFLLESKLATQLVSKGNLSPRSVFLGWAIILV